MHKENFNEKDAIYYSFFILISLSMIIVSVRITFGEVLNSDFNFKKLVITKMNNKFQNDIEITQFKDEIGVHSFLFFCNRNNQRGICVVDSNGNINEELFFRSVSNIRNIAFGKTYDNKSYLLKDGKILKVFDEYNTYYTLSDVRSQSDRYIIISRLTGEGLTDYLYDVNKDKFIYKTSDKNQYLRTYNNYLWLCNDKSNMNIIINIESNKEIFRFNGEPNVLWYNSEPVFVHNKNIYYLNKDTYTKKSINFEYIKIIDFYPNSFFVVSKNNKFGLRNMQGDLIVNYIFENGELITSCLAFMANEDIMTGPYMYYKKDINNPMECYEFIDKDGNRHNSVDGLKFKDNATQGLVIRGFYEGLSSMVFKDRDGKSREGYFDKHFKWIIPPLFDRAYKFKNGRTWVKYEGEWYLIKSPLSMNVDIRNSDFETESDINIEHNIAKIRQQATFRAGVDLCNMIYPKNGGINIINDEFNKFTKIVADNKELSFNDYDVLNGVLFLKGKYSNLEIWYEYVDEEAGDLICKIDNNIINNSNQPKIKPTFNCDKASDNVERTICSDNNLCAADISLNNLYKQAKSTVKNKDMLLQTQRHWLKQLHNECNKSNNIRLCVSKKYSDRIHELSSMLHKDLFE